MEPNETTPRAPKRSMAGLATPLAIVMSLVISVSGLMLMFGMGGGASRELHEWFGVLFVVAAVFHVWRNWAATRRYYRSALMWVMTVAVIIGLGALGFSGGGKGEGMHAVAGAVVNAPISQVAPLLGSTPEVVMDALSAKGIPAADATQSLNTLARANNRHPFELLEIAVSACEPKTGPAAL